jgi:hypothetical protein
MWWGLVVKDERGGEWRSQRGEQVQSRQKTQAQARADAREAQSSAEVIYVAINVSSFKLSASIDYTQTPS